MYGTFSYSDSFERKSQGSSFWGFMEDDWHLQLCLLIVTLAALKLSPGKVARKSLIKIHVFCMFTAPTAEFLPTVFASKTAGVLIDEPPNTEALEAAEIWHTYEAPAGSSSTCVCLVLQSWPPSCKAATATLSHCVKYFETPSNVKYAALLHLQLIIDASFYCFFPSHIYEKFMYLKKVLLKL